MIKTSYVSSTFMKIHTIMNFHNNKPKGILKLNVLTLT